jgi:hypothetical protein
VRPEAISPWTWHLVFLYQLSRARYPFKANDLSLETWLLMGTVRQVLKNPARTTWPRIEWQTNQKKLEDYRAYQEEMLKISREYSQSRWQYGLTGPVPPTPGTASQEWQANLEQMTPWPGASSREMAARGEASAGLLAQSWQKNLSDVSGAVEQWGAGFLQTLGQVAAAWGSILGSRGGGQEGWSSLLGGVLDFGGWFHQGGVVEAHQGMVISPGTLMGTNSSSWPRRGPPREACPVWGKKASLRTGSSALRGEAAPRYGVTIQVQTLDASGVAGLDWDRVVQRHLAPALRQEAARRW